LYPGLSAVIIPGNLKETLISWKLLKFFGFFGGDMAFHSEGIEAGTLMFIPGELHFIPIPGLWVETFSLSQRGRVRLKMLALDTPNEFHVTSLALER